MATSYHCCFFYIKCEKIFGRPSMERNGKNSIVRRWHLLHMLAFRENLHSLLTSRILASWMKISDAGQSSSTLMALMLVIRYEHSSINSGLCFYRFICIWGLFSLLKLLPISGWPISLILPKCLVSVWNSVILNFLILQVPFPMGVNIRPRSSKNRAGTSEESYQESQTSLSISKDFIIEESSSGSVKESNWPSCCNFVGTNLLIGIWDWKAISTQFLFMYIRVVSGKAEKEEKTSFLNFGTDS